MPKINILGAVAGSIIGFAIPIVLNHRIIKKIFKFKTKSLDSFYKADYSISCYGSVSFGYTLCFKLNIWLHT